MAELIGRTVLWEIASLVLTLEEGKTSRSTSASPFVSQAEWVGKVVKRFNNDRDCMAFGRVNCICPAELFENNTLGVGNIGVTVFDVFLGDPSDIMSYRRWPIADCTFERGQGLSDTLDHFNCLSEAATVDVHLRGCPKQPYQFICRKKWTEEKLDAFAKKTLPKEIQALSSQLCCSDKCVRLFRPKDTLFIWQKFWLKDFNERRDYARSMGGQLHYVGNNRKQKYVTLLGQDISAIAWYKIHGIPKSTFHNYMDQYKKGIISSTYENRDVKRPRLGTMQALGTIRAIINETTNHMPNQMRMTAIGRRDTLKFLPSGHSWKMIQHDATQVLLYPNTT